LGNLQQLADGVWVLPGGVNIGVLAGEDGQFILVDTGLNDTSAKKALKAVREELEGEVRFVLTTHAHADHYGGNATVVKRTNATVYAPPFDEAFLRYPLLQPAMLFGGADPLDTLRGNFLLADPSPVDRLMQVGPNSIAGLDVEAIPLYGHSPGQLGYVVGDVFFCADVVLPQNVLDKYRIPYLFSLTDHLNALQRTRSVRHQVAVAGHGPVLQTGELAQLVQLNAERANHVLDATLELVTTPLGAEAIMHGLLTRFAVTVTDAPSFYLLQPTVYACLSHLQRQTLVEHEVRDGRLLWRRA
jgi:glyoxylase-like metal-dependent hydrolase (beta-lactamase superfamily II)